MTAATSTNQRRVFVGVDGSAASAAALRAGAGLAAAGRAALVAVHAIDRPDDVSTRDEYLASLAARKTHVKDTWVRPVVGDIEVTVEVHQCDPRDVSYIAHEQDAAILVLGRTGSGGGPGFLHLGSVVEHAAHHSYLPLAVVPADVDTDFDRIAIGVDGSTKSAAAIAWCVDAGLAAGADIAAVSVDHKSSASSTDDIAPRHDEVLDWTSSLIDAGAAVEPVIQRGKHPADGLLAATDEHDSDLLVLGTRGRGGFLGLRIGGVALKVLHSIERPLVSCHRERRHLGPDQLVDDRPGPSALVVEPHDVFHRGSARRCLAQRRRPFKEPT